LHFRAPVSLGALGALALVLRRRDTMLFPLALLLGTAHGELARTRAALTCAGRVPVGDVRLTVRLLEPGQPRMPVPGRPLARCGGAIVLRWPDHSPRPAGATVHVAGRWVPRERPGGRPDGSLIVRTIQDTAGPTPGRNVRLRAWMVSTSEQLFGARAPMVDALVLGRRGGLDPELRETFARAGLVHILAISGFHVGLLTGWVVLAFRLVRCRRETSLMLGAAVGLAYVAFLGWPAPATRAAILGAVVAVAFLRQRRVQPGALLAVTCLAVMLVEPWSVTEPGAWLSAAAIWGLTSATRWSDRAIGGAYVVRTLAASVGATLATAPITAWTFGTVAIVGVLLNFAAIPLAAVAVPGILLTLLASPVAPFLAERFAAGTGLALAGLERLALAGSRVPGGALFGEERGPWVLVWVLVLGAVAWIVSDRATAPLALRRAVWVMVAGLWLALAAPHLGGLGRGTGELTLFLLDVGQGDATAVRTPGGGWVLIDAGPRTARRDAGRRVVTPFLARQGARRVEVLVLSHAHLDHLGGAPAILDRLRVGAVVEPGLPVPDANYLALLDRVAVEGVRWHPARAGEEWVTDGVRFRVLHPDTTWSGWREDLNEDSLVLLIEYHGFRALFAGDAGIPAEQALRGRVGRVDVLKAGHHGSRTATGSAWLDELQPRAVVLSLGLNRYGHPAPATLGRIAASGAVLWRTDRDGTVEVRTDGQRVRVRARGRSATFDLRPSTSRSAP
jgi:competence protein ComEC